MAEEVLTHPVNRPLVENRNIDLGEDYAGAQVNLPYLDIRGQEGGPTAVFLAGIHGDELNGVQIIHTIQEHLRMQPLVGRLLLVPVVNLQGFHMNSRYLPDRRDLNRMFPGVQRGSEGARLAHAVWKNFVEQADFGIDIHSASYERWNFPHVRGDMKNPELRKLASFLGLDLVLHSRGVSGSLRREATDAGIPFLVVEAGQSRRFEPDMRTAGIRAIFSLLRKKNMIADESLPVKVNANASSYYSKNMWIRSNTGGLFYPLVAAGEQIRKNQKLAEIRAITGAIRSVVTARRDGHIIGINLQPQVAPGRALFHLVYNEESLI